jgi:hypothetical protein
MNGFLAALDNTATAPVNPASTTGNVAWPSPFYTRVYSPKEAELNRRLFGNCPTRIVRFVKAIQLLWLVEDSVLSSKILATDRKITYNRAQLIGQLESVSSAYKKAASGALMQLPFMDVSEILSQELQSVWDSALTPVDKVAAVVVHFGMKNA